MRTTELFKFSRSSKRINESLNRVFGKKIDFTQFDTPKLEDARNKLRTQISQLRNSGGFNEGIENEHLTQVQWMHDAIVAELTDRQEHIVDTTPVEESDGSESEVMRRIVSGELDPYDVLNTPKGDAEQAASEVLQQMYDDISTDHQLHPDDDFEEILNLVVDRLEDEYGSADESIETEGYKKFGSAWAEELAKTVFDMNPNLSTDGRADELTNVGFKIAAEQVGKKRAQYDFSYDEDFTSDFVSAYGWLQDGGNPETGEDGEEYTKKYGHLFKGKDEAMEDAPPTAKGERMVKHIKKGYAKDGKLTDKEKSIAYATAWKQHNKEKNESIETGEDMTKLTEGEIQQASAIVTAKTMVDRVGRWIEELSGMENDTLLQLGDSIRDEMSADQAKSFISQCAPAIQQALENLKQTRETLSTGVRMLTGEEQGAEMLGAEPGAEEPAMGGEEELGAVEPDAMNAGGEEDAGDEFAAAEPGAGGMEAAGREQRESIQRESIRRQTNLLKVLAG